STPGTPRIDLAHYPEHPQDPAGAPRPPRPRPRSLAEHDFLALGDGAYAWLIEASSAGTVRIRAKMTAALELAALVGTAAVAAAPLRILGSRSSPPPSSPAPPPAPISPPPPAAGRALVGCDRDDSSPAAA